MIMLDIYKKLICHFSILISFVKEAVSAHHHHYHYYVYYCYVFEIHSWWSGTRGALHQQWVPVLWSSWMQGLMDVPTNQREWRSSLVRSGHLLIFNKTSNNLNLYLWATNYDTCEIYKLNFGELLDANAPDNTRVVLWLELSTACVGTCSCMLVIGQHLLFRFSFLSSIIYYFF